MPIIEEKQLEQWDAEIKQQSLHLKFDHQLEQIAQSLTNKVPRVQQDLNELLLFPDAKRKEIYEGLVRAGEITAMPDNAQSLPKQTRDRIDAEYQHELDYYQTKWGRLGIILTLVAKEQELRLLGLVKREPKGTTYYIDFDNGHDVDNDGTTATKGNGDGPWATLDKAAATLTAGDKAIVRRGMTQTVTQDLAFTNDGTIVAPITIEADYGDAWSDFVDLSGTGTATLTFGSKTVTFSADVSGVLAAGDWIYVSGDAAKDWAYEVKTVAVAVVTLYLPYKGGQAGAGKTVYNMGDAPIWNTAAGDFEVNLDADNYWKFQGIHFRGTDTNGNVELDSCSFTLFKDCIFEGNGVGDKGIRPMDDNVLFIVKKSRFFNEDFAILSGANAAAVAWLFDCLIDGNNVATSAGFYLSMWDVLYASNVELKNHTTGDIDFATTAGVVPRCYLRNCILASATEVDSHDVAYWAECYGEDWDGTVGDNRQLTHLSTAEGIPILQSDTTDVRAGGGATSIKVTPSADLDTNWEFSRLLLFEYPIYAVKDVAKTYTVYFKSDDDTDWDADPLNTELWIEAEYWGHATNVHRKITKSTGVCNNFDADDTIWDTLTVTVTPLQTGVLYLRGYYCKTKEAGKSNIFFCDTKIGIA